MTTPAGEQESFLLTDYALREWRAAGRTGAPPALLTGAQVEAKAQLEMQAALQPFVDNAISKTVSVPEATSFEAFREIYDLAYDRGLKGCAVFRPNRVTGEILAAAAPAANVCCALEREPD